LTVHDKGADRVIRWSTAGAVLSVAAVASAASYVMSLDDRSGRIKYDSATTVTDQVARGIEADIDSGSIGPDT
jgi:hypothetical protein